MSRTASETPTDDTAQTTLGRFTDVQERAPDWLWPGWLPLGKLAILDGDPGLGKSTLMFDLAAQRRAWSHGPGQPILCHLASTG